MDHDLVDFLREVIQVFCLVSHEGILDVWRQGVSEDLEQEDVQFEVTQRLYHDVCILGH